MRCIKSAKYRKGDIMVRLYDFGADTRSVSANERKAIAWPIAVWSCYISESELQEINILEHLILQLVQKGFTNIKEILCNEIGFNKELVKASIETCTNKGYLDKRYNNLTLSNDGKKILGNFDNPYSADLEASKKNKKIYMVQDLVTKSVVPVFDIYKLPEFYIEDDSALEIHYDSNFFGKKPKSASIKTALRCWARLCNNIIHGITPGINTINMLEPLESEGVVEDFIPFENEVAWDSIQEDGNLKKERTLAEKEEDKEKEKVYKELSNITILDDSPEIYYARGFIAINRNAPDEIIVISPFGNRLDDWFRTVINRLRAFDQNFEEEIQFFLELKKDELKDYIAFGNDLDIELFDEFPFICNDSEFKAVKTTITRLTVSKNRFQNGEDDTINFAQALRSAYEASIRLVIKKNPYLFAYKDLSYDEYKKNLKMLVNSYSFLVDDVFREYSGISMYRNMLQTSEEDGYATAFFALILMDAWKNKNGKSMDLIRNIPTFPIRLKELTSNLRRDTKKNKKGDGTVASHGGDAIAELKYSRKKVLEQYTEFEDLFRAMYNRFV